jgi:malate dehydrogenase
MTKISFIGAGLVGNASAYITGTKLNIDEIVMIDKNSKKAEGNAIDLEQAFEIDNKNTKVIGSYNYNDVKGSEVIVIVVQHNMDSVELTRELLLEGNLIEIKEVAENLKKVIPIDEKQPLIIVVTNPMDIILNYFLSFGFNKKRTIGSGNVLDKSRWIYDLTRKFNIKQSQIKTFAFAQHGLRIVYPVSQTTIDNKKLLDYANEKGVSTDDIYKLAKKSILGCDEIIIRTNSSTIYGPGVSVFSQINAYLNNTGEIFSAATYLNGEYGIKDFAIGVPLIIGKNGVEKIIEYDLDEYDRQAFKESYEFTLDIFKKQVKIS